MASPRKLAYADRSVWELEQVVAARFADCDGLTDPYIFPDMTTQVPLVLYLSQEEFTQLYSAVLTGADLSYPDMSHTVEYLFLQTVICAMNELCQAIADCITNNANTQDAFNQWLSENGLTGGVGNTNELLDDDTLSENLLPDGYSCTDDKAYGMALAIVATIHEATTEVLQAIEIVTNPLEIAAELGDNMPGVGILASAGDTANWIQDSAQEAYDLAWSTTVRDSLACTLWCLIKEDCELTLDMLWEMYLGISGSTPPAGSTLQDWVAWLVLLPFTADLQTVATVSLLGLLALRFGGSFGALTLGLQSLETVVALAQDDSSSDWSIVCDPCTATWCYEWFNGSNAGAAGYLANGCVCDPQTNRVIGCNGLVNVAQTCGLIITFLQPATITSIEYQVDLNPVRGTGSFSKFYMLDTLQYNSGNPSIGETTHNFAGSWVGVNAIRLDAQASCYDVGVSPTPDGGFAYINYVKIQGTGVPPMFVSNC